MQARLGLLGRELVGAGPARGQLAPALALAAVAGARLEREVVELHHRAVGGVGQAAAHRVERADRLDHRLDADDVAAMLQRGQAPGREPLVPRALRVHQTRRLARAETVEHDLQAARRHQRGVELLQRAGREVARVGVGLAARLLLGRVDARKLLEAQKHLAPNLDQIRHAVAPRRNRRKQIGIRLRPFRI